MSKVQVRLTNVRLSYVHLFEPRAVGDSDKPTYNTSILIDKSDKANLAALKAAMQAAILAGKDSKWGGKKPRGLKLPLKDGDELDDEEERVKGPEYGSTFYLGAKSSSKVPLVQRNPSIPITDPEDLYSGCYGNVVIKFWAWKHATGGAGISAELLAVQKMKDGERLDGAAQVEATDVFQNYEDEADEEDSDLPEEDDDMMGMI